MKDELITLKTDKLAKEKGFDWKVLEGLDKDGKHIPYALEGGYTNWNDDTDYSIPTQALLQRWLREVHSLHVIIIPIMEGYSYAILNKKAILAIEEGDDTIMDYLESVDYSVWEEALEPALLETLKLIK